jgi:hypothetical protein
MSMHLPLEAAYAFGKTHGLEGQVEGIRLKKLRWKSRTSSVRRGYIIVLFQSKGVFDEFVQGHWPFYRTKKGQSKFRDYLRLVLLTSVFQV